MTAIKRKLPRDPNQRAKSIVDIVAAISEGEDPDIRSTLLPEKDPERVARGKLGGANGGKLRAERLKSSRATPTLARSTRPSWNDRT